MSRLGKYPRSKSLLGISHLSRVQPSLRFWPDNFFHGFKKSYKICLIQFFSFLLSGRLIPILSLPYYRRRVSAPTIFHGASHASALSRDHHLERILECKCYGIDPDVVGPPWDMGISMFTTFLVILMRVVPGPSFERCCFKTDCIPRAMPVK